ncbi:hypothetical protein ACFZBZ_23960 [Streptomyces sp. NPDC008196]|uniref:hypothetical protein n=1 Tax=Streptomyces sp. NPDC008196 TaxID=3364819 RepID=UPI0036E652C7
MGGLRLLVRLRRPGIRRPILGCATRFGPEAPAFQSYVLPHHHQRDQRPGLVEQSSILGVPLAPRTDGRRPWDTTLPRTEGDRDLNPEEVERCARLWNPQPAEAAWDNSRCRAVKPVDRDGVFEQPRPRLETIPAW